MMVMDSPVEGNDAHAVLREARAEGIRQAGEGIFFHAGHSGHQQVHAVGGGLHAVQLRVEGRERQFHTRGGQLLAERGQFVHHAFGFGGDFLDPCFERSGGLFEQFEAFGDQFIRAASGHGFDAPDSCGGGAFADNQEHAHIGGALQVRAAAQFVGIAVAGFALRVGDGNRPHHFVVSFRRRAPAAPRQWLLRAA